MQRWKQKYPVQVSISPGAKCVSVTPVLRGDGVAAELVLELELVLNTHALSNFLPGFLQPPVSTLIGLGENLETFVVVFAQAGSE